MDIKQARTMSYILKEQTHKLANNQLAISPNNYLSALQQKFARNENCHDHNALIDIDWAAIGTKCAQWFLTVPTIQFMFSYRYIFIYNKKT